MKNLIPFLFISCLFFIISCLTPKKDSPNVIYILADDLGYGDVGFNGQKLIETPNIDYLAGKGMIFSNHYSGAAVCAPTRAVFVSGIHTGKNHIRNNSEWAERGDVWSFKAMLNDPSLEGQRPLPDTIKTVAHVFKSQGYKTGMVGKWGLGAPNTNSIPNKMGFDFFYGYNCQRQAHTYYPTHLWKNQKREFLNNYIVDKKQNFSEGLDPMDPYNYEDYFQEDYAPTLMLNQALNFIEKNKNDNFFLYYASIIPHLPLQAPKKWVDYYVEKFGDENPYYPAYAYYPNRYPKATYAAMISYLDEIVGSLTQKLKDINQFDNTIIMFTSDNGVTHLDQVDSGFFNSSAIFSDDNDRVKGSLYEGGIRVPSFVTWPRMIDEGSFSDHISSTQDFYATILDLFKIKKPNYITGLSFLPTLLGNKQDKHEYLYWETNSRLGQQAIRLDKWKAIRRNIANGNKEIELFNLTLDPMEKDDVSSSNLEVISLLEKIFNDARTTPTLKNFYIKSLDY